MINILDSFKFNKGDTIVIGCSGGPDSMALVDMLLKVRNNFDLSLIIAHVNHNVRVESYDEFLYVKDYCLNNNIIFETMTIEEYGDDNFENEARTIRYNFFHNIVNKYNANYLMTAHHGDDLIETILMRIVRGSNLNGYSGFKKIVDMGEYFIVRPLIDYTKEELEKYCLENNVRFFVDKSNNNIKYTRNRYRKYMLPFLKEENINVHKKFIKYSNTLEEANTYIQKERNKALKRVLIDNNKLMISKFNNEDSYIQKEILYFLLSKFYQDDLILINDKHINLIFNLINSKKVNSFINLPNQVVANKSYNMLELKRDVDVITSYEIEFDNFVSLPNNHTIERVKSINGNSNNICRLNSDNITLPLIVRTRKIGDKMMIKGLGGSRKVKDIFIDKKIKSSDRDSWPIVVDSKDKIVWIPGIKKSKFDRKFNENYDIILRYN